MSDRDTCDYCERKVGTYGYLRAVGFTDLDGTPKVLVKVHCGCSPVPDDIDDEAAAALRSTFAQQAG